MPKFRLLSLEELELLQKEFIDFLIVNGIAADDWEEMKVNEAPKAEALIEVFSDMVLETVLRKIDFIEHRGKNHLHIFQCLKESMVLVAMEIPEGSGVDINDPTIAQKVMENQIKGLKVFTSTKKYTSTREMELFDILKLGGVITDNRLFNALCLAL